MVDQSDSLFTVFAEKLERGREWQMSQSQRGRGELSLSQSSKEAESESEKEASWRMESILSKELNTSWGIIRMPHPRGRCELSCCSLHLPLSFWLSSSGRMFSSVHLLSRVWLLATPMDHSTPGLPVHRQLPEFTQTHVPWVGNAIQPSHPLLSPSPPAFNLSQHHGLFQWVCSSHQVVKVLEFQLQHHSFQWRTDLL